MSKDKFVLHEQFKFYPSELESLVHALLTLADRDYQLRVWVRAEGPEVDWYDETSFDLDDQIEYFKDCLRRKELNLTKEQIKAILRVHAMCWRFERNELSGCGPRGNSEYELYVINQPYWEKIREQAAYALSLIRLSSGEKNNAPPPPQRR